jgi:hypothetical protein
MNETRYLPHSPLALADVSLGIAVVNAGQARTFRSSHLLDPAKRNATG